jgi:hypothetical protein
MNNPQYKRGPRLIIMAKEPEVEPQSHRPDLEDEPVDSTADYNKAPVYEELPDVVPTNTRSETPGSPNVKSDESD